MYNTVCPFLPRTNMLGFEIIAVESILVDIVRPDRSPAKETTIHSIERFCGGLFGGKLHKYSNGLVVAHVADYRYFVHHTLDNFAVLRTFFLGLPLQIGIGFTSADHVLEQYNACGHV